MLAFGLPLAWRKVPMNHLYGFRTPTSYRSDYNWYEINAYAGRLMVWASVVLIATGVASFFVPEKYRSLCEHGAPFLVVAVVLVTFLRVLLWSRRFSP